MILKPSEKVSDQHSHWLAGVKARYPLLKYREAQPRDASVAAYHNGEPVGAFDFVKRKGWTIDPPHWPEKGQ